MATRGEAFKGDTWVIGAVPLQPGAVAALVGCPLSPSQPRVPLPGTLLPRNVSPQLRFPPGAGEQWENGGAHEQGEPRPRARRGSLRELPQLLPVPPARGPRQPPAPRAPAPPLPRGRPPAPRARCGLQLRGAQCGSVPAPPGAAGEQFQPGGAGGWEGAEPAVLRHRSRADPAGPAEQPLPCIHLLHQPGHHGFRGQGALPELLPAALRPLLLRHRVLHVRDHVDPPEPRRQGPAGVPGLAGLAVHLPAGGAAALEVLPGGRAPAPQAGPRRLRALPIAADQRRHGREHHADPDAGMCHGARLLLREHQLGQESPALQIHRCRSRGLPLRIGLSHPWIHGQGGRSGNS